MKSNSNVPPLIFGKEKRALISHKLKFIAFLMCFLLITMAGYAQHQQRFTVSMKKVPLKEVMDHIKEKSTYLFLYNDEDVYSVKNVTVEIREGGIQDVLTQALKNTQLSYTIQENTIIISKKIERFKPVAPTEKVEMFGQVVDIQGIPMPGVSVYVKGTHTGISTDANGRYRITVEGSKKPLVFSCIGMETQEISIQRGENNIVLLEDEAVLGEVVVTGYQKLGVNQAAGSFNTISMKDFEKKISSNLMSTLEGLSPSLVVSSDPSGKKLLTIRGISTLEGQSNPLIIVDGFPYNDDLSTINPYDIENITLLKDAASASIYGAKSANGVIVITTKRGKKGNLEIRYMSTTQVSQKPDIDYLMNRVSSSDMVDIESAFFQANKERLNSYQFYAEKNNPYAYYHINPRNRTLYYLLENKEGRMSQAELDERLAALKKIDNREDLGRLLLQTPLYTEHSVSASYGSKDFRLRSSLNYFSERSGFKGSGSEGVRYNLNSVIDVSDKFRLDLLGNFSVTKANSYLDSYSDLLQLSPYERFWDEAGTPLAVTKEGDSGGTNNRGISGGKDPYEIQRLKKLGLYDETYYPAIDYGLSKRNSNNWGARFQTQMSLKITDWLEGLVAFNINKRAGIGKQITDKNSWEMKSWINNLTSVNKDGGKGEVPVPLGSRIKETRSEVTDYLLRGQLDFNKILGENQILALIGSEIQANKTTSTSVDRLGYDARSNTFKEVDYFSLKKDMEKKFIPGGQIAGGVPFENYFNEFENRYFSFYANMNYLYSTRYVLSGSIRIDQSNLFGTDPKYRFKPFWSLGGKWRIAEEGFFNKGFFSSADLQLSYGINGNISNNFGPYDIAQHMYVFRANDAPGLDIYSYAVPDLRWEKTGTFNIGLHTQMLNERLSLTLDYYHKKTKDALADTKADPTKGALYVKRNDGIVTNHGFEVSLSSKNVKLSDFEWNTFLNFNYNKSRVDQISETEDLAYWIAGKVLNRAGNEPKSIYVFEWAGIDKDGNGLIRRGNGDLINIGNNRGKDGPFDPGDLVRADLKHAGTILPKTVVGLTNNFIYKNFSLSFMLVYQGGHILMRDGYNGASIGAYPGSVNMEAAKAWKVVGDENRTDVPRWSSVTYTSVSRGSTKNIVPGDFIRLRDIVFSYTLPHHSLKQFGINELTVNLTGKNLYLWTKNKYGIDPETQGLGYRSFPIGKSFTAGVNITF